MVKRFIAHPPGTQDADTYRQFVELQQYVQDLEDRIKPQAAIATVEPLVLTDAYQDVPLSAPLGSTDPGVYQLRVDVVTEGSTGNAEIQFQWVLGQTLYPSGVSSIGSQKLAVGSTVFATVSSGIKLQARGISAQILSGVKSASRVGAAP